MVLLKTVIKLFHFDLHSEDKSCFLPPLEWNTKRFKTNTQKHRETNTEVNFYYNLFLLTMMVSFKSQMSQESLIILVNGLSHAFTNQQLS